MHLYKCDACIYINVYKLHIYLYMCVCVHIYIKYLHSIGSVSFSNTEALSNLLAHSEPLF